VRDFVGQSRKLFSRRLEHPCKKPSGDSGLIIRAPESCSATTQSASDVVLRNDRLRQRIGSRKTRRNTVGSLSFRHFGVKVQDVLVENVTYIIWRRTLE
jgi:hypothetical protein